MDTPQEVHFPTTRRRCSTASCQLSASTKTVLKWADDDVAETQRAFMRLYHHDERSNTSHNPKREAEAEENLRLDQQDTFVLDP